MTRAELRSHAVVIEFQEDTEKAMTRIFLITTGTVLSYMICWFIAAQVRGRNDIADVAWGLGFILAAAVSLFAGGCFSPRSLLVSGLVLVWGIRLALHIHTRNRGKGEDPRYRQWREEWGRWFVLRSFLQVFMLQGLLLLLVAVPVVFVNTAPPAILTWLDGLGVAIWLTGFIFEAVGDMQLLRFIRNPANKGSLMTDGLWRYTRHPNYFGEVTLWWGIWLIALNLPGGWLTIIGPLTITMLILKVSGIPMLEKPYEDRPDFKEYKRRTSAFFPLPPHI
jgi:steroid 5-alpha reductase family enzyme